MSAPDGGPAYPGPIDYKQDGSPVWGGDRGMSLRDWFAGQALQGWLSGPCQGDVLAEYEDDDAVFKQHQAAVAKAAYGYADAMLKARKT